jgi:hypothetical protein
MVRWCLFEASEGFMRRALLGCFAGIGGGFLLAFLLVVITGVAASHERKGFVLVVGTFLAGPGAIAGAVVGGVADLLDYYRRRDQDRQWLVGCDSEGEDFMQN